MYDHNNFFFDKTTAQQLLRQKGNHIYAKEEWKLWFEILTTK